MTASSMRPTPCAADPFSDAGRRVELRYIRHDPQIPWQIFDAATGIYIAGFRERRTAEEYIEQHAWTCDATRPH